MKGKLLLSFLEKIGETMVASSDFFAAFLAAGYGASMKKLEYELSKRQNAREREHYKFELERARQQRYRNFLQYLKDDGLIEEKMKGKEKFFTLTTKAARRRQELRDRAIKQLPDRNNYTQKAANTSVIVSFDIPERERRKRAWLRSALHHLGLQKVQQSLWMGKVKIPDNFLNDLVRLRLTDYIEIFEISKVGSLRHLL